MTTSRRLNFVDPLHSSDEKLSHSTDHPYLCETGWARDYQRIEGHIVNDSDSEFIAPV
jgi:hypothetical protein